MLALIATRRKSCLGIGRGCQAFNRAVAPQSTHDEFRINQELVTLRDLSQKNKKAERPIKPHRGGQELHHGQA